MKGGGIPIRLDYDSVLSEILRFIQKTVQESQVKGVVVGLSGGVDSSLVASLCVRALGSEKVIGVVMPTSFTPKRDIIDTQIVADLLSIKTEHIHIDLIAERFFNALGADQSHRGSKIAVANIRSRIRMILLYYLANTRNYLVAGTGDKSEDLIGYFTKYGDGGADFLPIAHLYKTQVRELAEYVGIPKQIAFKPSSPQLYPGHKATDEIPADYDTLDPLLYYLFEEKLSLDEAAKTAHVDHAIAEDVLNRHKRSAHKRTYPPMVKSWPT